ncbi:MAG: D-glycero-alpha-D-manno-heptose-1,7-bisphosphate 7-phosphatase, partial [Alphaproteobacteria bacterium]
MSDSDWPLNGDGVWCEVLERPVASGKPALFLDRDGVIVEEVHYLHKVADVRLMPGVTDLVLAANRASSPVIVVTNQSGVGRGLYGWADFDAVQKRIAAELNEAGACWNAVYASPFPPGDYPMRKPNPGMLLAGVAAFGVDLKKSWILGDRATDMEAGLRAGIAGGLFLGAGYEPGELEAALDHGCEQFVVERIVTPADALDR